MDYDIIKNLTHSYNKKFTPFDDSTLKMMNNSSKGVKAGGGKGKPKKPSLKQIDSNIYPDPSQFSIPKKDSSLDLIYQMFSPNKKVEGFKFSGDQGENNEAQDLSKVRIKSESEINSENAETEMPCEVNYDADGNLAPTANVSVEMKSGRCLTRSRVNSTFTWKL